MNKMIKKGLLLFAAMAALSAFAVSSTASAANWGVVNTNHTLSTGSLQFYWTMSGALQGFNCDATLGVHVRSPASSTLDVTSAAFSDCRGTNGYSSPDCAVTVTPTGLPWTATGTTTSDVRLNVANLTLTYSNYLGHPCAFAGSTYHAYGTLTGGAWNQVAHSLTYSADTGLTIDFSQPGFPLPTYPMQTTSVFTETASPWLSLI